MTRTAAILFALVVCVAVRVVFIQGTPEPVLPDEEAHFNYARHMYRSGGRPPNYAYPWWVTQWRREPMVLRAQDGGAAYVSRAHRVVSQLKDTNAREYSYENYQQPGYYLMAAPLTPHGLNAVRSLSVVLFIGGMAALMWQRPRYWFALACFAVLPAVVVTSSMVTNASLLFAGCCALAIALQRPRALALATCCIIVAFAKVTGVVVVAAIGVVFLYRRKYGLSLACAIASVPAAALALTRWRLPMREPIEVIGTATSAAISLAAVCDGIATTVYTGIMHPSFDTGGNVALVAIGCLLFVSMFVLGVYLITRSGVSWSSPHIAAAGAVVVVWAIFTTTQNHPQGRLLYSVLPFLVMAKQTHPPPTTNALRSWVRGRCEQRRFA